MLQQIRSMKRLRVILIGLLIVALLIVGVRAVIFSNQTSETPAADFPTTRLDDEGQLLVDIAVADLAERLGIPPAEIAVEAVSLPSAPNETHTITLRVEEAIYAYEGQEGQVRPVDFAGATPTVPLEPLTGTAADVIEALRATGLSVEAAGVVEWLDSPHFYQEGRWVVLYLGNQLEVLNVLEETIGPQFAGSKVEALQQN